ncbi:mitochondrial carrier [Cerioporus squamosus]|nr:mitochondrial carrier [Cerioporus squamosus]
MEPFEAKLVAAAVGSTVTALTMTPFDVVKTRLQTQPPPRQPLFPNPPPGACCQATPASCVRNMSSLVSAVEGEVVCIWDHGVYRTERVNGFFDAVKHTDRRTFATSYMLTYDHLLNVTLPPLLPEPIVPLSAGIIARTTITSLMSPLELVRTNLQSTPPSPDHPHTLRSVLSSVRSLAQSNGWHYLWRGLGPTLWRDVPFSGLYWASYETTKRHLGKLGYEGAGVAFASGALSGTTAALITSPFDVLKTRRQAMLMSATTKTTSSLGLTAEILRTEGIGALYAGIVPRITKIAPACGIMIACFEGFGRVLTKGRHVDS